MKPAFYYTSIVLYASLGCLAGVGNSIELGTVGSVGAGVFQLHKESKDSKHQQ
jgi:hypothetical protein